MENLQIDNQWALLGLLVVQFISYIKSTNETAKVKSSIEEDREKTAQKRDTDYALLSQRVTALETQQKDIISNMVKLTDMMHDIKEDTSFIKGRFTRIKV